MRNALAASVKGQFDRRYATRQSLDDIASRLSSLEEGMRQIDAFVSRFGELEAMIGNSQRLATECAEAVEYLSQQGILLRQEIDAAASQLPGKAEKDQTPDSSGRTRT